MKILNIILIIGLIIPFVSCSDNTLSLIDKDFKLKRYKVANDRIIKYIGSNEFKDNEIKSEWYFLYGLSEFFLKNYSKSAELFKTSGNYKALFFLGVVNVKDDRYKEAYRAFTESYNLLKNRGEEYNIYYEYLDDMLLYNRLLSSFSIKNSINTNRIIEIILKKSDNMNLICWAKLIDSIINNRSMPIQNVGNFLNYKKKYKIAIFRKDCIPFCFEIPSYKDLIKVNNSPSYELIINFWKQELFTKLGTWKK